ncbi:MAG: acyl-CoA dehydrogenase [Deltaproteobacteria bacterium]|nr:acyl-CoA dehydrogenase [Deltaproteobacteria bacterium]
MAQQISDRRDVDFVLFEQMKAEEFSKTERYAEFNKKTIDLVVSEARNLAIKELLPTYEEADREGCRLENGKVYVPECLKRPYQLFCEGEWIAMADDPEVGGQGLPILVTQACSEYFVGANMAFIMYTGLTHGAGHLIEVFGTEKQKELYLEKMYSGKWAGTMLLTEPEAGTDVGNLSTTAKPNGDGTYSITGTKIFISAGDQDLTENIIHPVLARIEGAPKGTKGISLFIVPKIWVNDDGSLGEDNDVVCTAIEEKLGIHGSSTCQLALGSKGKCRGTLLGEENKGMRAMFQMMNEARLGVGVQGFALASRAYLHALDYARQRKQGRSLLEFANPEAPSVNIIEHPDVRRMLLNMKAYVNGMRSMIYYLGRCMDIVRSSDDEALKEKCQNLVEVMIPVVKAYCTDRGFEVCAQAIQVYGGYGYTKDYPVEQLLRDSKICSIYEGTNGVQAMDLLGRKLGMKGGKPFMDLLGEMNKTIAEAKGKEGLADMTAKLEETVNRLGEIAMFLGKTAMSDKVLNAFSYACLFQDVMGDVILGWMHLWRAVLSVDKTGKDAAFYEGNVKTAAYWMNVILPQTMGKMNAIQNMDTSIIETTDENFGAK